MNWMQEEYDRACARNRLLPPSARPIVTGGPLGIFRLKFELPLNFMPEELPLCEREVDSMGLE